MKTTTDKTPSNHAPDLRQHPPRSPRVRLGGYAQLPRLLDKGRATLADRNGEYHYNSPLDQRFFNFAGINGEKLLAQLKQGKGDGEILAWIEANAKHQRAPWEVQQWSDWMDRRGPDSDAETMQFSADLVKRLTSTRGGVTTGADGLDLGDYVRCGGEAAGACCST